MKHYTEIKYCFFRIKELFLRIGKKWDSISISEDDAIDFAHKYINPEPPRMIDSTQYSYEYVLAHYGTHYSDDLRKDKIDKDNYGIMEMIKNHICKCDLVLYRGIHNDIFNKMLENARNLNDIDLYEKGYMQCSLVKGHESRCDKRIRVFVPSGTHVVYLGNVNDEQYYYEVDIQHGAKLNIISIDKTYINCRLIETE